ISELLNRHYVFPDVAKTTGEHLKSQFKAGYFDKQQDVKSFAEALTKEAQAIAKDKHLRIRPMPPRASQTATPEQMAEGRLQDRAWQRENTAGFASAKKLEGNIGYLDLRGFAPPQVGAPIADHYMALLATSDAVIIDLRKNGGGSPAMVQYLCSYFFDQHVHLNSLYWREGDRTEEFWTLDKVGGKKMPDVPLFVLTGKYTFSGAEEFSYNMQTQKRATLVGETTGGGANPGGSMPVNDKLMVFIPTGKAINPVTKTNWEGVGVVPEVQVAETEAMDKALELATEAAAGFRRKSDELHTAMLRELFANLDNYAPSGSGDGILASLKKTCEAGLLDEQDINALGYEYLMQHNNPQTAEVIFYCNTVLFPNSANTYDSYGEALATNGKLDEALKIYRKAVDTAKASNDQNLGLFEENLKKIEGEIKKRP
ncbi:MAG TPA: S41 family peptidase, partial [Saprospiraceae bacterium]|nr:S41 family peptidase [Saprospiraceae bacterium]